MKTILILTGWTRGLGEGILRAYSDVHGKDLAVIGIARSENRKLADLVRHKTASMHCITGDLSEAGEIEQITTELSKRYHEIARGGADDNNTVGGAEQSILINNAAVIGPIEMLPNIRKPQQFYEDAERTFALNCVAPALLSGCFLKICAAQRNLIINISSGASQGAMDGAGIYSMSKTALNMLSRILVSEQKKQNVKILSLSPGMVETFMQKTLRESKTFPNAEYFREAAKDGTVRDKNEIGKIIAGLSCENFENGQYYHLHQLQ